MESWEVPPYRKLPKLKPVKLQVGEPVSFNDVATDREGWTQVATKLEAAVRELATHT